MNNKIALVDRGTCDFATKVLNAQMAGAIAVIVANNEAARPSRWEASLRRSGFRR